MTRAIVAQLLSLLIRLYLKLFIDLKIVGGSTLPDRGPLVIVSNHFSWFEAPLVWFHLPYEPTFMVAAELAAESSLVRMLFYASSVIEVRRGQVDRTALRQALDLLENDGVLMIFPEGGIDPELIETVSHGESVRVTEGQRSRVSGQLIRARPGSALLAVRGQATVLPIAFHGTERVQLNSRRLRRTRVTMSIGEPFVPIPPEPNLRGRARRRHLDQAAEMMMRKIAALLPPESRGPYG